jgi:rhodanese-related sulfurtransferase
MIVNQQAIYILIPPNIKINEQHGFKSPIINYQLSINLMSFTEITVTELATKLADLDRQYQFVDVREQRELELAALPRFIHLPLSEHSEWSSEIYTKLDKDLETFVLCHHGIRSAQMCQWLIAQGFTQVSNIIGGIDAYSYQVDASLPKY